MSVAERPANLPVPTTCYSVEAMADPGVMARILALFDRRGLVPSRWHAAHHGARRLVIDVELAAAEPALAARLAVEMRAVCGVARVLAADKATA